MQNAQLTMDFAAPSPIIEPQIEIESPAPFLGTRTKKVRVPKKKERPARKKKIQRIEAERKISMREVAREGRNMSEWEEYRGLCFINVNVRQMNNRIDY